MESSEAVYLETPELKTRLETAIKNLLPSFDVSVKDSGKFRKYRIRRPHAKSYYSSFPSYNPETSVISFPLNYWTLAEHNIRVYHESAHYLHHIVNPLIFTPLEGELLERERRSLIELVADYAGLILNLSSNNGHILALNCYEIYQKCGPKFLPNLARMGLVEARDVGII